MFRLHYLILGAVVAGYGCEQRPNVPVRNHAVHQGKSTPPSPPIQPSPLVAPPKPGANLQIAFVEIPSGDCLCGAPPTEPGFAPVEKQRLAVISRPFWVSQTELTQEQYQRFTGKNPSLTKGAHMPVTCVTWNDVQEFLHLANAQSPDFLLRLPTEEEWEYTCRARSSLLFAPPEDKTADLELAVQKHASGDPEFLFRFVGRFAWYRQIQPQPVAQLAPNAWGLYDMHGNVWEWCEGDDPDSDTRPLRGGAWSTSDVFGCRAALRTWEPKDTRKDSIGIRLLAERRE